MKNLLILSSFLFYHLLTFAQPEWAADLHVTEEHYIQTTEINVQMIVDIYHYGELVQVQPDFKFEWYRALPLSDPVLRLRSTVYGFAGYGTHTYQDPTEPPYGLIDFYCKVTMPEYGITINSDDIRVPWYSLLPDQKLSSGSSFGTIDYWYKGHFKDNNGLGLIYSPRDDPKVLQADVTVVSNPQEKYYFWTGNQTHTYYNNYVVFEPVELLNLPMAGQFNKTYDASVRVKVDNGYAGEINFKDPWLRDFDQSPYGIRNRGLDVTPMPIENIENNVAIISNHQGIFLNQEIAPNKPFYSVQVEPSQTINLGSTIGTRSCYFRNWDGVEVEFEDANNPLTGVIFKDEIPNVSPTAEAKYKGQGLSSDQNTFIKSGQRKIVRTPGLGTSSTLHRVYQDMGYVWYETSTDNGQTWNLRNGAQSLGVGGGKNPAIDWAHMDATDETYIVVVFQRPYPSPGNGYDIVYDLYGQQLLSQSMTSFDLLQESVIYRDFTSSTFEANPVVAITENTDNLVADMDIVWQTSAGIYFYSAYINADPSHNPLVQTAVSPGLIPNTNGNSINPSIDVTKLNYNGTFGLTWEENNTIKYRTINGGTFNGLSTISNDDGYTYRNNPSLVMLSDNYARVCYKATRFVSQIDPKTKTDNSYWDIRTVFTGSNFNHFWYFGQNVGNPNINKSDAESYYAIIWNQDENSTFFADNSLSGVLQINDFPGSSVQASNGPDNNQMYADIINTQSLPYYFKTTNSLGSYYTPHKATNYMFSSGREGVIAKDTAQFYFAVGDVMVDNNNISFINIPDSIVFNSNEILNEYLVSEPFQLTDNSTFLYSIQYGITDSSAAANLLNNSDKYISFKLQLVDEQTLKCWEHMMLLLLIN